MNLGNNWPPLPPVDFAEVVAFGQLDESSTPFTDSRPEIAMDIIHRSFAVFSTQLGQRRFVRSFLLTGRKFYLAHVDRSGLYISKAVNIDRDPDLFLNIFATFLDAEPGWFGLDQTLLSKDKKFAAPYGLDPPYLKVVNNDEYYILETEHHLAACTSINGRGSVVRIATSPDGSRVAIKNSWRTVDHDPEGEFLKRLKDAEYVIQNISHTDLESTAELLKLPAGTIGTPFKLTSQTKDSEFYGYGTASPTSMRRTSKNGATGDVEKLTSKHTHRIHSVLIMPAYPRTLEDYKGLPEMLEGLLCGIRGHREAFQRGVLHRDLSTTNIMFTPEGHSERAHLIDFDFAKCHSIATPSHTPASPSPLPPAPTQPITGTHKYISSELLENNSTAVHSFDHDLQSIFYILMDLILYDLRH